MQSRKVTKQSLWCKHDVIRLRWARPGFMAELTFSGSAPEEEEEEARLVTAWLLFVCLAS